MILVDFLMDPVDFGSNSIFCNFKNGQKSIFELGKSLKLPEMQFHEKKFFDLFDFTSFFARTFLNFLALCVPQRLKSVFFGIL